jgi:hypothetical protein
MRWAIGFGSIARIFLEHLTSSYPSENWPSLSTDVSGIATLDAG